MAKKDELMEQLVRETLKERVKEEVDKRMSDTNLDAIFKQVLTPELMKQSFINYIEKDYNSYFDDDFFQDVIESDEKFYKTKMKNILNKLLDDPQVQSSISKEIKESYLSEIAGYCVVDNLMESILDEFDVKLIPKEVKLNRKSDGKIQR